ncbi:MAG: hypothetical protein KGI19_07760 [Thaumarchaeota archaeon]|nr:hypothetical protein [Nitrososphaerota archaeon]
MKHRRKASFLYKINTDESKSTLLEKIKKFLQKTKINTSGAHPWHGFLVGNDGVVVFSKHDQRYYSAKYGLEVRSDVQLFDDQTYTNYIPEIAPVLFDLDDQFVVISSSTSKARTAIYHSMKLFLEDENFIKIDQLQYSPDFLRWLVHNATDIQNGLFNRIDRVKLVDLMEFDPDTTDVQVGSDDQVRDSEVYRSFGDNGRHVSISGFVRINSTSIPFRIYSSGKITLTADPSDYGTYLIQLATELERLRSVSTSS